MRPLIVLPRYLRIELITTQGLAGFPVLSSRLLSSVEKRSSSRATEMDTARGLAPERLHVTEKDDPQPNMNPVEKSKAVITNGR